MDRQQRVAIDGLFSNYARVDSGVPQGSILGPLLFVLFINDIPTVLNEGTRIRLYADDTKIWRVIHGQEDMDRLQEDIDSMFAWSIDNKMKFHPAKCKVVNIRLIKNPFGTFFNNIVYYMDGEVLDVVSHEKDLGVKVTDNLNFNSHHRTLLAKASQKLGLMRRICHFNKNVDFRKLLFLAVIRSQFEHASPVWRPVVISQVNKFEAFQKRSIKFILNIGFASLTTLEYFNHLIKLDILPMYLKFKFNDLVVFHKAVHNLSVTKLPSYIISANSGSDGARYFARQTRQFNNDSGLKFKSSVTPRINIFKNSFFIRTMNDWNSLPKELREVECTDTFKLKLKQHMWVLGREDMGIT